MKIRCIKNFYMDGRLIFKKDWCYPAIAKTIDGDKGAVGYKVKYDEIDDEPLGIWFWSGSDYFAIDILKSYVC